MVQHYTDPVQHRIMQHLRLHVSYACRDKPDLKARIGSGNYSFSELDDQLHHIGSIFCDEYHGIPTKGSVRYGDCLAVPDDRGVVHLVFLGLRDTATGFPHTVAGSLMPEDADEETIHRELRRMWQHRHEGSEETETYVPAVLVKNNGHGLDLHRDDAHAIVGRINRWFAADVSVSNRVRVGDFMETRLKRGASRGHRLRVEATEAGFVSFIGDEQDEDGDITAWRMIWQSHSLAENLEFAVADSNTRAEYVNDLVFRAAEVNGVLRYLNGALFGALESSDSIYLIKHWMVYQLDTELHGVVFNPSLDVRDAIAFCH